jgi:hypothetical protein
MDELSTEWMTLAITMRRSLFAEIEAACLRRGMPLDELLTDGLACSVLGELPCHRCVTLCDACRPVT